jgi:hypothetical protein
MSHPRRNSATRAQVERQLVQDVLHACQGMDGTYISLGVPGDHPTSLTAEGSRVLSPFQRGLLLDLSCLGWLYRCRLRGSRGILHVDPPGPHDHDGFVDRIPP